LAGCDLKHFESDLKNKFQHSRNILYLNLYHAIQIENTANKNTGKLLCTRRWYTQLHIVRWDLIPNEI